LKLHTFRSGFNLLCASYIHCGKSCEYCLAG